MAQSGRRSSINVSYNYGGVPGTSAPEQFGSPSERQRYGWGDPSPLAGGQDLASQFRTQFQPNAGIFSPSFPLVPVEPELTRLWDYPVGYNYIYTPRSYEPVSFDELRALANTENLTRMAIETRKDQIERLDWEIRAINDEVTPLPAIERRIKEATQFWRHPDGDRPFGTWLREILEDMLVIDAPALELLKNRDGSLRGLDIVDGSTIKLLIDITGRRPVPPAPAFQQIIHGRPWRLFNTDELIYFPRNKRPGKIYGYCYDSETEILTRRGFVRFRDLTTGDVVATRNPQTKHFEWQRPTHIIDQPYSGPMYHLHSRSLDLLVTPQHRVLLDSMPAGANGGKKHTGRGVKAGEVFVTAEDLARGGHNPMNKIPMTSEWVGVEVAEKRFAMAPRVAKEVRWVNQFTSGISLKTGRAEKPLTISGDDYCALLGAYLAEGNLRSAGGIEINQRSESKGYGPYGALVARILGGPAQHNGKAFVLPRRGMTAHFESFGLAHEKFIPDEIKEAPQRQLRMFWDHFVLGDGCFETRPNRSGRGRAGEPGTRITTVSRRLADGLVEVAQKLGWHASVTHRRSAGQQIIVGNLCNVRDSYVINVRYSKAIGFKMAKTEYNGSIHCVTVPNGVVYVRRNGKPAWSSNSPVEQILITINIAIRRSLMQLNHFTEGNVPPGLLNIPDLNAQQVAALQQWMDDKLAGNFAERQRLQMVPYATKYQALKEAPLKDEFDEWLARVVMFAFSLPPDSFIKQRSRATSETARQTAQEEGLGPLMLWVKRLVDGVLQKRMGHPDLEFAWQELDETDPQIQATILTEYVKFGINTPNEARDTLGLDPVEGGDDAMLVLATGPVLIKHADDLSDNTANPPPPPAPMFGAGQTGPGGPAAGRGGATGAPPRSGGATATGTPRNTRRAAGGAQNGRGGARGAGNQNRGSQAARNGAQHAQKSGWSDDKALGSIRVQDGVARSVLERQLLRRERAARVEADLRKIPA